MSRDWVPRENSGELNGHNNWTNRQARMIREYRAGKFTISDLVKLFGGTESSIADLCNGKTYKTAGGPIAGVDYPKGQHSKSIF